MRRSSRDAQRRPRRLEARPLAEVTEWLDAYRRFWAGRFQQLDALLDEMKTLRKPPTSRPSPPKPSRSRT